MPTLSPLDLKDQLHQLAGSASSASELMRQIVKVLYEQLPNYNWVGFYMLDTTVTPPVLQLDAFQGAMTPHVRIPLTQGICGAAASSGRTLIVDDVAKDARYLACSLETKSEIVAPVFLRGKVVGELDIDSHSPAAFKEQDQQLVEFCCALVGKFMEDYSNS